MTVVLLAEDDDDIAAVVNRVLTRSGMTVLRAADGREAFQAAVAQRPDVVLTDLGMPLLDGWGLVAAIRGHDEIHDVPVAILSGHLQLGDPRVAEAQACVALLKPCPNDRLLAAIEQLAARGAHRHGQSPAGCMAQQPTSV